MSGYNSTSTGTNPNQNAPESEREQSHSESASGKTPTPERPPEFGGRKKGLEPTRYGDWEKDGRCIDF
ncbi:MAG: DUF1674 domain-containing protein [Gammaproteobacteria bacterium]|jgi:hypothetical protein|nr:DUF1674 domain-containing protein [Gammaproteobacteria bacterium]